MADDQFRAPNDHLRPNRPTAPRPPDRLSAKAAGTAAAPPAGLSVGTEAVMYLRWMAGMILVLCLGWGVIFGIGYLAYASKIPVALDLAAAVASVLDLGIFLLLQRKLWLSRFMGLRIDAHTSPLREAVLMWVLGVAYLMFRSTAAAEPATDPTRPAEHTDSFREIVETVVFVVVLVLLLKTFVAEAFVIPTGSMASTLLGYHKMITCPQCGHTQPVNCSAEVEPQKGQQRVPVDKCECENCRYTIWLRPPNSAERDFR